MFRNQDLADASLIINSVDPCISCMERTLTTDRVRGDRRVLDREALVRLSREKTRRLMAR